MDEPPPTATTASKGPQSRAKAIASSSEASVGSTRAPANTVTSSPLDPMACAIRWGWPVAATPASVTSRTRLAEPPAVATSCCTSQPISSLAPRPNFRPGAA
jgi:hypothetical protein